ncbi:MAG: RNA polymerase factor sigma-54, partial [Candidatus Aureabacteria bacterium]|nr:RNA polymerase factor sigma-54 [Candidatus Auribacterota bacterium]
MALKLEQHLKLAQQLVMSPQMQQAIKILQLPLMELRATIQEELNANPVLEEVQDRDEPVDSSIEEVSQRAEEKEPETFDEEFQEEFEKLKKLDDEWRDYYHQTYSVKKFTAVDEEKRRFFQNSITAGETLHEHLLKQLRMTLSDKESINIGEEIIGNIDDNGYLRTEVENISQKLGKDNNKVEEILKIIHSFHPLGVGARNIRECLLLQMERVEDNHMFVRKIIDSYLDDLAKKRYPQIARRLKITLGDVKKAADFIATLEPKPGRIFSNETSHYITPDIFIVKNEESGHYDIVLNDDRIPHLRISNLYSTLIENKDVPQQTKEYIRDKIRSGMWLIKNIYQRQQTLFRITEQIVKVQKRFLEEGIAYLKPLTMQEVADALSLHESTVSRAIANKYAQTPRGLFQLKYFFTSKIRTENGDAASSRSIKQKIKNIVEAEDKSNPLSDQEIIEKLKAENIV